MPPKTRKMSKSTVNNDGEIKDPTSSEAARLADNPESSENESDYGDEQNLDLESTTLNSIEKALIDGMSTEEKLSWIEKTRQFQLEMLKLKNERMRLEKLVLDPRAVSPRTGNGNAEDKLEKYARQLKACAPKMPNWDLAAIPSWLNAIETAFAVNDIPEEFWGRLLVPLLNEQAKQVFGRLTPEQIYEYQTLKSAVLDEFRLAPGEYLARFLELRKGKDESWTQFVQKLDDLLAYYWKSKSVDTADKARKLCVADHVKKILPQSAREYVTLQEGNRTLSAHEIAQLVQKWEEAIKVRNISSNFNLQERRKGNGDRYGRNPNELSWGKDSYKNDKGRQFKANNLKRNDACLLCGKIGHYKRDCPLNKRAEAVNRQVNQVRVDEIPSTSNVTEGTQEGEMRNINRPQSTAETKEASHARVARVSTGIGEVRTTLARPLEEVQLLIEGKTVKAVIDSGAQITIIRSGLFKDECTGIVSEGKIGLVGAFGKAVEADIVTVKMSLAGSIDKHEERIAVAVMCAATDELQGDFDCLINPHDLKTLQETKAEMACRDYKQKGEEKLDERGLIINREVVIEDSLSLVESNGWMVNQIVAFDGQEQLKLPDAIMFAEEQRADPTLSQVWDQAERGTHNMIIENGILYHKDNLNGMQICQLVVPHNRRVKILEMAHDSWWGGHLGSRKTSQRVRLSFHWPGMTAEVKRYCQSCPHCQKRKRPRDNERVKITPLLRPQAAFDIVNLDIVGPIDPPSARGHKYVLCLIDITTRWPEVIPLRSLNAKATCEALLQVFSRTGIPKQISSDQGTNFTASLTREMMQALGVEVRFSTPEHPNSNGTVERWNGTFKNMLSHVIREKPRQWDKAIQYLAWAYREVPNETTGVSPFQLLYGRVPNGPLSVLADEWSGKSESLGVISNSGMNYLREIKEHIDDAMQIANATAEIQQQRYAHQYNLRKQSKDFSEGEQVLILKRNPENKLAEKWIGPGVIIEKVRGNSYAVCMEDGTKKWVHADNLRKYVSRVAAIGVTFEDDEAFGEVQWTLSNEDTKEQVFKEIRLCLNHLNEVQNEQLLDIIRKHNRVFSAKPGRTDLISHKIRLRENFEQKKVHPYRVPIALREEVSAQIKEMIDMGWIVPAQCEIAHPIVCVAKREGGVRICVDFRALNAGTIADAFPMHGPNELIYRIANAKYITVIDLARGYWQVPMEEQSVPLTAFMTHDGTFVWKVMPFGLKNSAATFQRLMNCVLASHSQYATAYIDDVAVYSKDWQDHMIHLERVLETLSNSGLTANPKKCKFAQMETEYLGKTIGSGRHAACEDRVVPIRNQPRPKSKKELRQFLGFCGYYREYIPDYATIALPLTSLTGKRVSDTIPWDENAEEAFQTLKNRLCDLPKLYAPRMGKPFYLYTDASDIAVGACLAQMTDEGKEAPIAFISKKLTSAEKKWSVIEREAFGVIWALKKFDIWLFGSEIFVVTDHNPLIYLTSSALKGAKLTRWALALQRYNVTILHRKGSSHLNADWLSRLG